MWEYWLSLPKSGKGLHIVLLTQHYLVWFRAGEDFIYEKPFQLIAVVYSWTRQPTSLLGRDSRGKKSLL